MTEPGHPHRRADDRWAPLKVIGTAIGVLLSVSALIWGAARISASVDNMNLAVAQLQSTTSALKETITGILVQQARNQAEIEALRARIDGRVRDNR